MKKKRELATARARLYPSTYKQLAELARNERTSIAKIVADLLRLSLRDP